MDALLERLSAVVDALAGLEPTSMADGEMVVVLSRVLAQVEAAVCRQSAAFDRSGSWARGGAQNAAAWITTECRVDRNSARRRVRLGRALQAMDLVDAAFTAGRITGEHVNLLTRARERSKLTALAFGRDEAQLVRWATTLPFHRFKRHIDEWLLEVDTEAAERDAATQRDGRRLHLSQSLDDMWFLDGVLDPIGGEIVHDTLTAITDELFDADWAEAKAKAQLHGERPTGEQLAALTRSPAQRRVDALVEMATRVRRVPADARRPQPLFTVLVGEASFARTIELPSGTTTTPGQLAPWLDDALLERIVFDGPSRVLDIGEQREFRGALRRAVEVLGRECCSDYCSRPALQCEVDHVIPVSNGGTTTQENGRLYCAFHHRLHHRENHPGFRVREDAR